MRTTILAALIVLLTLFMSKPVLGEKSELLKIGDLNFEKPYSKGNDAVYVLTYDGTWGKYYENETWLFDKNDDGSIELIIKFYKNINLYVAEIYDDRNGDRKVEHIIENGKVVINEGHWTVRVSSPKLWSKDISEYTIEVDGDVNFLNIKMNVKKDGKVDYVVKTIDSNKDGITDYEVRNIMPNVKNSVGNLITVNVEKIKYNTFENYILWPLLGSNNLKTWERINREPPVQVDFKKAQIVGIVELIPSRKMENGYFIFKVSTPLISSIPQVFSGENPFGFYDIANDKDGKPELVVRMDSFEYNMKPYYSSVRYSWDANNDNSLDYSLLFLGKIPITTTVRLEPLNLELFQVPYEKANIWPFGKSWDVIIFTAIEGYRYGIQEGIYENFYYRDLVKKIIFEDKTLKLPPYIPMKYGQRAEIIVKSSKPSNKIIFYKSGIDGRVHIMNATYGIILPPIKKGEGITDFDVKTLKNGLLENLKEYIVYFDIDSDGFVDTWIQVRKDSIRALIYFNKYLIYYENRNISIMKKNIENEILEICLPITVDNYINIKNMHYKDFVFDLKKIYENLSSGEKVEIFKGTVIYSITPNPSLCIQAVNISKEIYQGIKPLLCKKEIAHLIQTQTPIHMPEEIKIKKENIVYIGIILVLSILVIYYIWRDGS